MPHWVTGPDGVPTYVDETGAPVSPLGSLAGQYGLAPDALLGLANYQEAAGAPPVVPPPPTIGQPAPPVAHPALPSFGAEPATLPSSPPQAPPPGVRSEGSSSSQFSLPKFNEVGTTRRGLEGDIARAQAPYAAQGNAEAALLGQGAADQRQAMLQESNAKAAQLTAQGQQNLVMQALQDGFAQTEQEEYAKSRVQAEAAKADYTAQIKEQASMVVDPGQIFKGPGSDFFNPVAIAAGAMSGYLGAKGIKTDWMGMLNGAIDHSMNAQIANIRNKGEVAAGFRGLWEMQRAQSASDAEARQRVRGFILESTKNALAAEMSKYDSELAQTQYAGAIAKVNEELVKNLLEVHKTIDANALQAAQQRIQIWGKQVDAALTREGHQIERDKLELDKAKTKATKIPLVVRDPSTGEVIGEALNKDQQDDFQTKVIGAHGTTQMLVEMQNLMRKVGPKYSGTGAKTLDDKDSGDLRGLYNQLVGQINRAQNGARATDADAERIQKQIPFEDLSLGLFEHRDDENASGIAEYVASKYGVRTIDAVRSEAKARLAPVSPQIAAELRGGAGSDLLSTEYAAQNITAQGRDKPTESPAAKLASEVTGKTALRGTVGGKDEETRDHAKALHAEADQAGLRFGRLNTGEDGALASGYLPDEVPEWFDKVAALGELAHHGDHEAMNQLGRLTNYKTPEVAAAAQYFLSKAAGALEPAPQTGLDSLSPDTLRRFQGRFGGYR